MPEDKLLSYLKLFLNQTLKSPLALPGMVMRIRNLSSIARQGEKIRLQKEMELGINIPFLCIFSVTWRCNLDCKGCYAANYTVKEELSIGKICRTVEECQNLGIYFFVIAGGEPLLIEGLLEKIASFKKCFFLFYTNGTILGSNIQILKKAYNILPVISVEGEDRYIDLRRGEGVSEKVITAMNDLKNSHIPFGFSTMITHLNLEYVTSREWLETQWQRGARFGFFTDYIPFGKNLEPSFILTDEDRACKESALQERKKEARPPIYNLPPDEYEEGRCLAAGKGMIHINSDGYVEPCPYSHFAADNIKDKSMEEVLRSDFFKELRRLINTLDNPRKECMLFSHQKEAAEAAEKTGAIWTEN